MPDKASIEIKGLDKLRGKIDAVEPKLKIAIKAATVHIKGVAATYPKATEANLPKVYVSGAGWGNFWYERGWGQKWAVASSDGWHGRKSSEQLGQKWATGFRGNGLIGIVGNNASYAKYVQGFESERNQKMKKIGWQGVEEIAESERDEVIAFVMKYIGQALE